MPTSVALSKWQRALSLSTDVLLLPRSSESTVIISLHICFIAHEKHQICTAWERSTSTQQAWPNHSYSPENLQTLTTPRALSGASGPRSGRGPWEDHLPSRRRGSPSLPSLFRKWLPRGHEIRLACLPSGSTLAAASASPSRNVHAAFTSLVASSPAHEDR